MKNLALRATLVVLVVAGFAGAGYFLYLTDRQVRGLAADRASFDHEMAGLQSKLADLRATQPAYLVPGQDRHFWSEKMAALLKEAQAAALAVPQAHTLSNEAGQEIGTLAEALASFARFDTRVRELLDAGQPLTAAGLVFGDSAQLLGAADKAALTASARQAATTDREVDQLRWRQAYVLAGAAGFALLVLLLLMPRTGQEAGPGDASASPAGADLGGATAGGDLNLAVTGDPDLGDGIVSRARPAPRDASEPDARPQTAGGSSQFSVGDLELGDGIVSRAKPVATSRSEHPTSAGRAGASASAGASLESSGLLTQIAALCGELARVNTGDELQHVLTRAAALLDAAGIVLWMAGPSPSDRLEPALSCGYAPQVLAKMGALPRDGENAVSSCVRGARMEVVPAVANGSGAIVVPLLTSAGCTGAMAIETRNRGEASEVVRSLATIIAAQIAAFLPQTETN